MPNRVTPQSNGIIPGSDNSTKKNIPGNRTERRVEKPPPLNVLPGPTPPLPAIDKTTKRRSETPIPSGLTKLPQEEPPATKASPKAAAATAARLTEPAKEIKAEDSLQGIPPQDKDIATAIIEKNVIHVIKDKTGKPWKDLRIAIRSTQNQQKQIEKAIGKLNDDQKRTLCEKIGLSLKPNPLLNPENASTQTTAQIPDYEDDFENDSDDEITEELSSDSRPSSSSGSDSGLDATQTIRNDGNEIPEELSFDSRPSSSSLLDSGVSFKSTTSEDGDGPEITSNYDDDFE